MSGDVPPVAGETTNTSSEFWDQIQSYGVFIGLVVFLIALKIWLIIQSYNKRKSYYSDPDLLASETLKKLMKHNNVDFYQQMRDPNNIVNLIIRSLSACRQIIKTTKYSEEDQAHIADKYRNVTVLFFMVKHLHKDNESVRKNILKVLARSLEEFYPDFRKWQDELAKIDKPKSPFGLFVRTILRYLDDIQDILKDQIEWRPFLKSQEQLTGSDNISNNKKNKESKEKKSEATIITSTKKKMEPKESKKDQQPKEF